MWCVSYSEPFQPPPLTEDKPDSDKIEKKVCIFLKSIIIHNHCQPLNLMTYNVKIKSRETQGKTWINTKTGDYFYRQGCKKIGENRKRNTLGDSEDGHF